MILHIGKHDIPENIRNLPVVIYGGGYTGRIIFRLLSEDGVKISHIIDDNEKIHGEVFNNTEIISFHHFADLYKDSGEVAVILGTIYGKAVLSRLEKLPYVRVYELYEWYNETCGMQQIFIDKVKNVSDVKRIRDNLKTLSPKWADGESQHVIDGLMKYIDTRDINDIADVCTVDEHYFIPEVLDAVSRLGEGLRIVDGGAYWGELLQAMKRKKLSIEKWWCFEPDQENFDKLLRCCDSSMEGKQVCIRKGLWSSSGALYFEGGQGTASKIVDNETEEKIDVVSIDDYFKDTRCNFIKMDFGNARAEYEAVMGSIQTIKRDRPILAISIDHGLDDLWRIPKYLMDRLDSYRYYVRHHSMIFCETVLYAIPGEE